MEESVLPATAHGSGFEPVSIRQFTVFLANRVGRLQALLSALEDDTPRRIVALAIEESGDAALVRLICSDSEDAREALRQAGFPFNESALLAVEIPQKGNYSLTSVCSALLAAEINVHYVYPLLWRPHGPAIALYVDDNVLASQLLLKKGFRLIGESDLRDA